MKPQFKDFNFKLAVIEVLMYRRELLTPKFDLLGFVKGYKKRKINLEKESYAVIPEVKRYFENLAIPEELLKEVRDIHQGYHKVYHQIIRFWSGEDDVFNITSTEDLALLPNLKSIVLLYDSGEKMAKAFRDKGIEASYL